jgi:hypothetical protein
LPDTNVPIRIPKTYTSEPIPFDSQKWPGRIVKACVEFYDIDHSGPSFEGRIFLNNPNANQQTKKTTDNGYAGSIYIFGHGIGGCYGDAGHCEPTPRHGLYDFRPSHPLIPGFAVAEITEALRRMSNVKSVTVTVVPVVTSWNEITDVENILKFKKMSLIVYDK